MCKWGCRNSITSDAMIFNVKRINEAAKQLKIITGKDLKLNILTDNVDGAYKRTILKAMLTHVSISNHDYVSAKLAVPEESAEGRQKDIDWFMKNVAPHMTVKYVGDLKTTEDSPHIDYSYDFE